MQRAAVGRKAVREPSGVKSYWKAIRTGRAGSYDYVSLVGMETSDPVQILKRVAAGLHFRALERFQENSRFSTSDLVVLVAITPRTLHRRKEQGRLEPDESDRLLRVSRVFGKALELFEGDAEAARDWFHRPAKALGGERPLTFARTDLGSRAVEALIDRIEQGVLT